MSHVPTPSVGTSYVCFCQNVACIAAIVYSVTIVKKTSTHPRPDTYMNFSPTQAILNSPSSGGVGEAVILFLLLLLLPACGGRPSAGQAHVPAGDTVSLRYATGFDIVRHGHFTELLVYNPWQSGAVLARYYLVGDDTAHVPTDGTRLRVPLRHVALTSVTHVSFMEQLGVLDRVVGLCSPHLTYNATLRTRAEAGGISRPPFSCRAVSQQCDLC